MKILGNQVQKLDDRSRKVINLGKEPDTKGYRLYDPENNKVYVSRDVVFEETKSWHWNQGTDEILEQSVPLTVQDEQWEEEVVQRK